MSARSVIVFGALLRREPARSEADDQAAKRRDNHRRDERGSGVHRFGLLLDWKA